MRVGISSDEPQDRSGRDRSEYGLLSSAYAQEQFRIDLVLMASVSAGRYKLSISWSDRYEVNEVAFSWLRSNGRQLYAN